MHATFTNPQQNGKHEYGKETVNAWTFIVNTRKGLREPVRMR